MVWPFFWSCWELILEFSVQAAENYQGRRSDIFNLNNLLNFSTLLFLETSYRLLLILYRCYRCTAKYQYAYSPCCTVYIFKGVDKENLFDNQELLKLVIIFLYCPDLNVQYTWRWMGKCKSLQWAKGIIMGLSFVIEKYIHDLLRAIFNTNVFLINLVS